MRMLEESAEKVAPMLLGWRLVRQLNGATLSGVIVETEAYDQSDAASHSYRGKTPRTEVMFGPAGRAYVYFTYGMHYCMNVVTGDEGQGSAVLIRALEPLEGIETMKRLRKIDSTNNLTNGPAKLCQALAITKQYNGHDLTQAPLQLLPPVEAVPRKDILTSARIGISKDTHRQWRFYIADSTYVSSFRH